MKLYEYQCVLRVDVQRNKWNSCYRRTITEQQNSENVILQVLLFRSPFLSSTTATPAAHLCSAYVLKHSQVIIFIQRNSCVLNIFLIMINFPKHKERFIRPGNKRTTTLFAWNTIKIKWIYSFNLCICFFD